MLYMEGSQLEQEARVHLGAFYRLERCRLGLCRLNIWLEARAHLGAFYRLERCRLKLCRLNISLELRHITAQVKATERIWNSAELDFRRKLTCFQGPTWRFMPLLVATMFKST